MRVQPHLPSNPLLATVMSRSGSALQACSAANSPAPPEPRIRMSVLSRSSAMPSNLEYTREEQKCDDRRQHRRDGRQLFLLVAPGKVFKQQEPYPPLYMHQQQKYEAAFGKLHQRRIAP